VYSPQHVSISQASAIALRLRPGRFYRDARPTCANLLLNYADNCLANCAYCGLARERPVEPADRSFIRVEWPAIETGVAVERMAQFAPETKRVCLSMVTHGRAYTDSLRIVEQVTAAVDAPLSLLIAPNLFNRGRLQEMKDAGVDMIGIGLDAASERVFSRRRGRSVGGGLAWDQYWDVVRESVDVFGRGKVNCHLVAGLGETDADMVETIARVKAAGAVSYLFCFYPEAGSRMARSRRPSLVRWRRLQLIKHLIEGDVLDPAGVAFDARGRISRIDADPTAVRDAVASGEPFRTDGCPGRDGVAACNRPFGSYRPGESFRDYPFPPDAADLRRIERELRLHEILGGTPVRRTYALAGGVS
jgi:biotin synthase-related radical SAM superfamily protein